MRPNADIPRSLNAEAKEYAEATGQTLSDAWRDVIETGLRELRPFSSASVDLERPDRVSTETGSVRDPGPGFLCPLPGPVPRAFRGGTAVYTATLLRSRDLHLDEFPSAVASPIVDAFGDAVLTEPGYGVVDGDRFLYGRGLRDLYFTLEDLVEDAEATESFSRPGCLVHPFDDFLLALTFREVIPGDRFKDVRGLSLRVLSPGVPYSNDALDALADALGVQPFFRETRAAVETATRHHADAQLTDPEPSRFAPNAASAENPLTTDRDLADFLETEDPAATWFTELGRIPVSATGSDAYLLDDSADLRLTGLQLLTADDLRMFHVQGE